eukprot:1185830-Prorocentrum_minimum.AAC.3
MCVGVRCGCGGYFEGETGWTPPEGCGWSPFGGQIERDEVRRGGAVVTTCDLVVTTVVTTCEERVVRSMRYSSFDMVARHATERSRRTTMWAINVTRMHDKSNGTHLDV